MKKKERGDGGEERKEEDRKQTNKIKIKRGHSLLPLEMNPELSPTLGLASRRWF